jgi:transposase InsO family protein
LFGLSKQAYYKTVKNDQEKEITWHFVKPRILELRRSMPRLGTRKLHYLLGEKAIDIGRDRLFELLRKEGMLVPTRKKYVRTTNSTHWMRKYPNLVRDIELSRPEQLWVADITYLDTKAEGNLYLHLVTDAYSKQIMGYELCDNMTAISTHKALKMAISKRQYKDMPLIHHSDRGLQYCSSLYTEYLTANNIAISMTENGDPYENAVAERINGILKDEFGLGDQLNDIKEALKQTEQGILAYNHLRPHLSCNMLTPVQMHRQQTMRVKTYKQKVQTSLVDV